MIKSTLCFAYLFLASVASARAQEVTLQTRAACKALPLGSPAAISANRNAGKIAVHVLSSFGCSSSPADPKIGVWVNSATLSVHSYAPPDQPAASCLCAQELSFEVQHLPESVTIIYYVQDGLVLGHVPAP